MGTYLAGLAAARRQRLARMQDAAKPANAAAKPIDAAVERDDMAALSARVCAIEEQLAQLKRQRPRRVANESISSNSMMAAIEETICRDYAITRTDLEGPSLFQALIEPRQVAMYLCRRLAAMTYQEIAHHFGGRNHTSVMHACGKIDRRRIDDEKFDRQLSELEQKIRPSC